MYHSNCYPSAQIYMFGSNNLHYKFGLSLYSLPTRNKALYLHEIKAKCIQEYPKMLQYALIFNYYINK